MLKAIIVDGSAVARGLLNTVLTDGDDPKMTPRQLERIDRLGGGIIINTIEFGAGPRPAGEGFLVKLARQSGGKYAYVDITGKQ